MLRVMNAACLLAGMAVCVKSHGTLTQVKSSQETACAVHTGGCSSTGVKMREIISRSGNTGVCANPPGCRADYFCDHCGLEKVLTTGPAVDNSKWWTSMPAANWDLEISKPQVPCMSDDAFGRRGTMKLKAGDALQTKIYVNADHSGLYRFQLVCGETASNSLFDASPITPWKALHATKEGASLRADRVVGSTRAETDAFYRKTTCTGAACTYRMNRDIQGATSSHCKNKPEDCFVEDTITIPADFQCSGSGILRWLWNSAEGPEVYANCLDVTFATAGQPAPAPSPTNTPAAPSPTPKPAPETGGSPDNTGLCFEGEHCGATPTCCPMGEGCYEKDEYWASCMPSCTPGVHASDPPMYRTPWTCKLLGGKPRGGDTITDNQAGGETDTSGGSQGSGADGIVSPMLAMVLPVLMLAARW